MSTADPVIAALRTGHDGLAAIVSGFGDDDLTRPSGAADWDLSQVLSHLGSGAEISLATVQAALDGKPNPGSEFNPPVWDRWNAMTPRERADGFLRANQDLTLLYESLDEDTRENLRIDLGYLPAPADVAAAARLRLLELTLHSWDVRVGTDPAAVLPVDATEQLLRAFDGLIAWISKPEALNGQRSAIQVATHDPESVFILLLDSQVSVSSGAVSSGAVASDGELNLPGEAWLRLVAGRLAPERTPGGVSAAGAADLGVLRQVFPGY